MSDRDDRQIPLPEPVEREDEDEAAPTRRLLRNFVALVAVGGLAGIVWYAYEAGVSAGSTAAGGDGAVPVIRADAGPIKEKVDPAGAGGIDVPYRDRKVYDLLESGHEDAVKKTERVPPKRAPETGGDGEGDAVGTDDDSADRKDGTETAAGPPKKEEGTKPEAQLAAAAPSGFRIQLAAVSSAEEIPRQWQRITSKNKDLLGNAKLMVEKIEVPAKKQTLYRIQAGPFASAEEARDVCAKLAARKVSCFFVKG